MQDVSSYLSDNFCHIENGKIYFCGDHVGNIFDDVAMIDADFGLDFEHDKIISVSFRCLQRFDKVEHFEIVDYVGESHKYQKKSPGLGYVLISKYNNHWHRSPTVLLRHKKYDVLMGVDDNQYFGCELPERCKTIKEAKDSLIPKGIRKVQYERQGEWFIVKSEFTPEQMGYTPIKTREEMIFPLLGRNRTNESNDHMLYTNQYCWVKDDFNMNGGKDILMARSIGLHHNEHPEHYSTGWVFFLENLAVRSFSEMGVD